MNFDLVFEEIYPHPVDDVWRALTSAESLSAWLNEMVGFEPVVGCRFRMLCRTEAGELDVYHCEILELEPPRRMLWSWLLEQPGSPSPTRVEFRLEPLGSTTRLEIRHSGERSEEVAARFREGWPTKMSALRAELGRTASAP